MIGIDEVGRGAWAGPLLVVAAKAQSPLQNGLKDSKRLSRKQRSEILNKLNIICSFGEGWVEPAEIDELGLAAGMRLGVSRALLALSVGPNEEVILDGKVNYCPENHTNVRCLVNADKNIPLVAAASIYAKVVRDGYMHNLDLAHPGYRFAQNVGYGTSAHRQALYDNGTITGVHRFSFKPVSSPIGP